MTYRKEPKAGEYWCKKSTGINWYGCYGKAVEVMSVHVFGGPIIRIRYDNPNRIGTIDTDWHDWYTYEDLTPDEFHRRFDYWRK